MKSKSIPELIFYLIILICFSSSLKIVKASNILFFMGPVCSYSHRAALEPLANKLADNGHNVTFFGPLDPIIKHPKVTNVCPAEVKSGHKIFKEEFGITGLKSRIDYKHQIDVSKWNYLADTGLRFCEIILKSPGFQDWVKSSSFDLIVFDKSSFIECAFPLSYIWNSKVVSYYSVSVLLAWDAYTYGVPTESSWIPFGDVQYETEEVSFYGRLYTEVVMLGWYFVFRFYYLRQCDKVARTYLNVEGMPHLEEIISSEQLVLLNSHYSDHFPKALHPFMIPVGGMQLHENTDEILPQTLETFLDQTGEDGFMYISFGSIVLISTSPESLIQTFFKALKDIKLHFVWKWEGEFPKNIPKNVMLCPWLPQKRILAHPKIRGFITQGGQLSMQEAIFYGIPVIIFPVNGDQDYNAKRVRTMGNGIEMELSEVNSRNLKDSVLRLVKEERYSDSAKLLSKVSQDRLLTAKDTAVWWLEFVLRHEKNVTNVLKPFCVHQPWWKKKSLDVWGFLFLVIFTGLAVLVYIIREQLCSRFEKLRETKDKKKRS